MEAKEKAKELVDTYLDNKCFDGRYGEDYNYIYCALIAVDEIINTLDSERIKYSSDYCFEENKYWTEVKQEIEKI